MLIPVNVTVEDYNDAISQEMMTHARVTFVVDNVVFQDEELEQSGITLLTYMNSEENLRFGKAYSTEVNLTLFRSNKTDDLNFAHEFTLEFGVDIEDEIEWVKVGHFVADKPVINLLSGTVEIIARDRMMRFEKDANEFIRTLAFPCSISDIYDRLCDYVVLDNVPGNEIADVMNRQMQNADNFYFETCRDLLAAIAEANGCYAKITSNGEVKLAWFEDHTADQNLIRDNCFGGKIVKLEKSYSKKWAILEDKKWKNVESVQYSEYDNNSNPFKYSYIHYVWEDNDTIRDVFQPTYDEFSNGRLWAYVENYTWDAVSSMKWKEIEAADDMAGKIYAINNNPFILYDTDEEIKAHLQWILDKLTLFRLYYAASIRMVGNWLIEPGDTILFEVSDGNFIELPVFNRVLSWNGACNCEYETTGLLTG